MKKGFTLVEMLVVIAILGILMAMMVPAAGLIIKRTKIARAQSDAGVVTTVMMKYHAEYNRWPDFFKEEEKKQEDHLTHSTWVDVMSPSPGKDSADNLKRIVFFTPGGGALETKSDSANVGAFVDPWGKPFHYHADTNGDGEISNPNEDVGGTIRATALAWSEGQDGDPETWDDNVTSWE